VKLSQKTTVGSVLFLIKSTTKHTSTRWAQKNFQTYFCQNFVKFPPNLIIFGKQMAKTIEIYVVHSLSTSRSLRQPTTM